MKRPLKVFPGWATDDEKQLPLFLTLVYPKTGGKKHVATTSYKESEKIKKLLRT